MKQTLILASSSINRLSLLKRLCIDFEVIAPEIDEKQLAGESANDLVIRLAIEKAMKGLNQFKEKNHSNASADKDFFVIGSDQVLEVEGEIFGKPYTLENAKNQLNHFSNKTGAFHTSVCLVVQKNEQMSVLKENVLTQICFRALSQDEIENYLEKENALQCAGSFKSEGLGLSLLEWIKSTDHSAVIGLPLIKLTQMLKKSGFGAI